MMKNKHFTILSFISSIASFIVFFLKVEFNAPSYSIVWCWILLGLALLLAVVLSSYLTGVFLRSTKINVVTGMCIAISSAVLISNVMLICFCIMTL